MSRTKIQRTLNTPFHLSEAQTVLLRVRSTGVSISAMPQKWPLPLTLKNK